MRQRETLPDRVFDEADEVELIDLPPDDLLARLRAGKIYRTRGRAARRPIASFAAANLLALRELALRRMTDRVEAASRAARRSATTELASWLARDRVLVAIGPDPQSEQTVRAGKRIADALDAEWTVVYVETPALLRLSEKERNRRIDAAASRRIARRGDGDARWSLGRRCAARVRAHAQCHARASSVRRSGAAGAHGCGRRRRPSLRARARDFDVITIAARETAPAAAADQRRAGVSARNPSRWRRYAAALAIVTLVCTGSRR